MKPIYLYIFIAVLFFTVNIHAQTCTPGFIYTLTPNGNIVFFNTSTSTNTTPTSYTYTWDLGNNVVYTTTSLSQTVGTNYTSNGTYSMTLTMQDNLQSCTASTMVSIPVVIQGCSLSANTSVSGGGLSNPVVHFSSISTGTTLGTNYYWNFGDGSSSTLMNPTHTYNGNGVYGYTLIATNNSSCSSFIHVTQAQAHSQDTTFICSYTPSLTTLVGSNGAVILNVSHVGLPVMGTISCTFGDNIMAFNDTVYYHTYFNGTYTPAILINIANTCTFNIVGNPFTITNNACSASAAFNYTTLAGGTVLFSKALPPADTSFRCLWDFGDGVYSHLVNPTHVYTSSNNYSVTLLSYYSSNPISSPSYTSFASFFPCSDLNITSVNVTGISCIANSNFTVFPSGTPQTYWINPAYPYNIAAASWDWGDNSTSSFLYANHTYSAAGSYDICLTVTATCGATATTCFSQYLSKGTTADMIQVNVSAPALNNSIYENTFESIDMELFPNPNAGTLNIRLSQETTMQNIGIYDLLGNLIYFDPTPPKEEKFKIELYDFTNGIYFLQVKTLQGILGSKFILSK